MITRPPRHTQTNETRSRKVGQIQFSRAVDMVRELLAQRYGSLEAADAFGGRALAAGACDGRGLEAVLSRRELAVLALLPSLRSMDEIACDLSVLINRV